LAKLLSFSKEQADVSWTLDVELLGGHLWHIVFAMQGHQHPPVQAGLIGFD
jgi:hypothetical protein